MELNTSATLTVLSRVVSIYLTICWKMQMTKGVCSWSFDTKVIQSTNSTEHQSWKLTTEQHSLMLVILTKVLPTTKRLMTTELYMKHLIATEVRNCSNS